MQDKREQVRSAAEFMEAFRGAMVKHTPVQCWNSPLMGGMPIHFGEGAIEKLPELLLSLNPDRVFIISDHRVFNLHGAPLLQILSPHFAPEIILIPEGESEKKISNLEFICEELFA